MSNKDLSPRLLRLRNEFEIVAENSMLVMGNLNDYRIRFLNTEGVPVEDRPVAVSLWQPPSRALKKLPLK